MRTRSADWTPAVHEQFARAVIATLEEWEMVNDFNDETLLYAAQHAMSTFDQAYKRDLSYPSRIKFLRPNVELLLSGQSLIPVPAPALPEPEPTQEMIAKAEEALDEITRLSRPDIPIPIIRACLPPLVFAHKVEPPPPPKDDIGALVELLADISKRIGELEAAPKVYEDSVRQFTTLMDGVKGELSMLRLTIDEKREIARQKQEKRQQELAQHEAITQAEAKAKEKQPYHILVFGRLTPSQQGEIEDSIYKLRFDIKLDFANEGNPKKLQGYNHIIVLKWIPSKWGDRIEMSKIPFTKVNTVPYAINSIADVARKHERAQVQAN